MRTAAVVCWGLFGVVLSCSVLRGQEDKRPPAPVIAVLTAAKESDITAFKNAYSKRIREDTDQADWEKNLKEAQAAMKKQFGDFQLTDFSFTFAGDKVKGKVTLSHKGKAVFPLAVIKEGDNWKVDER